MDLVEKIKRTIVGDAESLKRLVIEQENPLVLFGEANFTHAVAIAALRGGWNEITATSLDGELHDMLQVDEALRHEKIESYFRKACLIAINFSSRRFQGEFNDEHAQEYYDGLDRIKRICNLQPPHADAWKTGVDATRIVEDDLHVEGKIVWFQCPWGMRREGRGPANLVRNFLRHMAEPGNQPEYILIGISTHGHYVQDYHLDNILELNDPEREDSVVVSKVGEYKFLGSDCELIEDILKYGYKHEGAVEIHDFIFATHLTLVFKRDAHAN